MEALAGLNLDGIGMWLAFVLTLMVFSYLVGDNPLYRLAQYLLVGTAAGYAIVVAYHAILRPRLVEPLLSDPMGNALLLIPLLLAVLLLTKGNKSVAWLGNTSMGFLFGVGAALAVGGALIGTLATQLQASFISLRPADYAGEGILGIVTAALVVIGTTGTLVYFYYGVAPAGRVGRGVAVFRQAWGRVGHWFILIALGAIFANMMVARLSLLIGRIRFLLETLGKLAG